MTNPSKRELQQAIESLDDDADDTAERLVIETTVIGTGYESSTDDSVELAAGETRTKRRVLEVGGADE